jgi:hypothetical protein
MMTDLFETDDRPTVTFDDLVGEGKKYRTADEAARAIIEKDNFIERLQQENATARQELRSRTNLEEVVAQLRGTPAAQPEPQPNREIAPTPRQEPVVETETDIETLIRNLLKQEKDKDQKTKNLETAQNGLRERFGADYKQTLKSIVDELGVSEQFVNDLAAKSPTGFLKLIDSVKAPDDRAPVTPPPSRTQVAPNGGGRRNKAYYDELRRTNINEYLSPRVQNQLYKDAMEQGESFYK